MYLLLLLDHLWCHIRFWCHMSTPAMSTKAVVKSSSCLVPQILSWRGFLHGPYVFFLLISSRGHDWRKCSTVWGMPQAQFGEGASFILHMWWFRRQCPVRSLKILVCSFLGKERMGSLGKVDDVFSSSCFQIFPLFCFWHFCRIFLWGTGVGSFPV